MSDKIAAIATGHARTGIGVLRLSGDGCIEAAEQVFRLNSGRPLSSLSDRKLALGTLFDAQGRPIDHCMAFISRAPHSYTGEDTAEIQCHGSPAALTAGLEALFAAGFRQARPGEFTRRQTPPGRSRARSEKGSTRSMTAGSTCARISMPYSITPTRISTPSRSPAMKRL